MIEKVSPSVVKVFVTSSPWDPFTPWQRVGTETSTGSATVLSGNRLLTNAHVVEDAVSLEVKAGQPGSRYAARVSFVDAQADLALLEVEDASFFASVRPLTLGVYAGARYTYRVRAHNAVGSSSWATSSQVTARN